MCVCLGSVFVFDMFFCVFVLYVFILAVETDPQNVTFGDENLGCVFPGSGNAFLGNPSLRMFEHRMFEEILAVLGRPAETILPMM